MHIRCPHCRNPIEFVEDIEFHELLCPSCGSSFNLLGLHETKSYSNANVRSLAQFELLERVGVGHFGAVWKARDKNLDRWVAVKTPRREQLSPDEVELFFREARAAGQLKHPNIVAVHEVGRDGDVIFIVSDYIEGANLREWLAAKRLSPRECAKLLIVIANALHHAHEAGVVHRDLKPSNIMVDGEGRPHVMDFGLAKREVGEITVTMDGKVLGTPAYMSPEQASGKSHQADRRSDVYALGVMLFETLTGELPFRGEKRMLLTQIIHDDPPSPRKLNGGIDRNLETICLKAMNKEPARRYQTALEFADDLERYVAGRPIVARPIGPAEQLIRWAKRKPSHAIVAALLAIVACLTTYTAIHRSIVNAELAKQNKTTQEALRESQRLSGELLLERGLSEVKNGEYQEALHWVARASLTDPNTSGAAAYHFASIENRIPYLADMFALEMMPIPVDNGLLLTDRSRIAVLDFKTHETRVVATQSPDKFNINTLQQSKFNPAIGKFVVILSDKVYCGSNTSSENDADTTVFDVEATIVNARVSPDGRWAVVVTEEAKMIAFDLVEQKQANTVALAEHFAPSSEENSQAESAILPSIRQMAIGGAHLAVIAEGSMGVWNLSTNHWVVGDDAFRNEAKAEHATDLAIDSSGELVAIELHEDNIVLFDIVQGKFSQRPHRLSRAQNSHASPNSFYSKGPGNSLWFSRDGQSLTNSFINDNHLCLMTWNVETGNRQLKVETDVRRILNADSQRANDRICFRDGGKIRQLRPADGRFAPAIPIGPAGLFGTTPTGATWTFEFSKLGRASNAGWAVRGLLRVWADPRTRTVAEPKFIQSEVERMIAYDVAGKRHVRLLSEDYSHEDKTVTVRMGGAKSSDSWKEWTKATVKLADSPRDVAYDPHHDRFLAWSPTELRVFRNGQDNEIELSVEAGSNEFRAARWSQDGRRIAVLRQTEFESWDVESRTREASSPIESASRMLDAAISPNLLFLAILDVRGQVTVVSRDSGVPSAVHPNSSFLRVKFASDSASLLCWGDQELQAFDLALNPISRRVRVSESSIVSADIAIENDLLAAAIRNGGVQFFTYPHCNSIDSATSTNVGKLDSLVFGDDQIFLRGDDSSDSNLLSGEGVVVSITPPRRSQLTAEQMVSLAQVSTGFAMDQSGVRRPLGLDAWEQQRAKQQHSE